MHHGAPFNLVASWMLHLENLKVSRDDTAKQMAAPVLIVAPLRCGYCLYMYKQTTNRAGLNRTANRQTRLGSKKLCQDTDVSRWTQIVNIIEVSGNELSI